MPIIGDLFDFCSVHPLAHGDDAGDIDDLPAHIDDQADRIDEPVGGLLNDDPRVVAGSKIPIEKVGIKDPDQHHEQAGQSRNQG